MKSTMTRKTAEYICRNANKISCGYCVAQNHPRKHEFLILGSNWGIYGWNWTLYLDPKNGDIYIDGYRNFPRF